MSANDDYQKRIAESLNQLAKMTAYSILESEEWKDKSNGEKIYFLFQMGFESVEIALMIGTSVGTVQKEISNRKR